MELWINGLVRNTCLEITLYQLLASSILGPLREAFLFFIFGSLPASTFREGCANKDAKPPSLFI